MLCKRLDKSCTRSVYFEIYISVTFIAMQSVHIAPYVRLNSPIIIGSFDIQKYYILLQCRGLHLINYTTPLLRYNEKFELLHTKKYSPRFYFRTFRPRFQRANSSVSNYFSLNATVCWRIQDGTNLFAREERRNGVKITLVQ